MPSATTSLLSPAKLAALAAEQRRIAKRAERADRKAMLEVLSRVKDREVVEEGDRIEPETPRCLPKGHMRRIMYIECKAKGVDGPGRIGWVDFTKSGRSFLYNEKRLKKFKGGYKYNCFDVDTMENYWVSGPKKNGEDKLYGGVVEIDEDAREEYWNQVRGRPQSRHLTRYRS